MQKQPIDAITNEAVSTLADERLLKIDDSSEEIVSVFEYSGAPFLSRLTIQARKLKLFLNTVELQFYRIFTNIRMHVY